MTNNITQTRPSQKTLASAIQQQFWLLHQLNSSSPAYNIPSVFSIAGTLDIPLLEQCFQAVCSGHSILRSTLVMENGNLYQVINNNFCFSLVNEPLKICGSAIDQITPLLRLEIEKPFDLATGPLIRARLFIVSNTSYFLAITMHHCIVDLHSKDVFAQELSDRYNSKQRCNSTTISLPYESFANEQLNWIQSKQFDKMLSYWKKVFLEKPTPLSLFTEKPRCATRSLAGSAVPIQIAASLQTSIEEFQNETNVSDFVVLLCSYACVLFRYSGQENFVIGVPFTNRRSDSYKNTLGCFVNTLPIHIDINENTTFLELVTSVRKTMLFAHRNQEVSLEAIAPFAGDIKDRSRNPVYQVGFTFEHPMHLDLTGASVAPLYMHHGGSQLDLFLTFWKQTNSLTGLLEYDSALFDKTFISNLANNILCFTQAAIQNSSQKIVSLALLSDDEKELTLYSFNKTLRNYAEHVSFVQLFNSQVLQTPHSIAVEFGDKHLSYSQLNTQANNIACQLHRAGVTPKSTVVVCLQRSLDMLVSILGILKAGCAYVPIDPSFPKERIRYIVTDSGAISIISQQSIANLFLPTTVPLFLFDNMLAYVNTSVTSLLLPSPTDLAYIIYTSGSTGQPKGVENYHRSLINFLLSMKESPGIQASDSILSVTTISFDISILELLLPLCVGAKTIICETEITGNGVLLANKIGKSNPTIIQATPATWSLILDAGWKSGEGKTILCGGEALPTSLANRLLSTKAIVWNMYGPTETTIWSAVFCVKNTNTPIPVGYPVANTQIYIVDKFNNPVPIYCIGEICIGGTGLAKGYHNRQELTNQKFVSCPFMSNEMVFPETRMYRTGDRGYRRVDGSVVVLGRMDFQVKIRGFRIELGEIETTLVSIKQIRECIVTDYTDSLGIKSLIAYIVFFQNDHLPVDAIRQQLGNKLPSYMIPSYFVVLPSLPRLTNNKIDRAGLPLPALKRPDLSVASIAASTPIEHTLKTIWTTVLGIDTIGVFDNFFDIGGHSMAMARVHIEIEKQLGRNIDFMLLFEYPTIRSLAAFLQPEKPVSKGIPSHSTRAQNQKAALQILSSRRRQQVLETGTNESAVVLQPIVPILTESMRSRILFDFNNTQASYSYENTLQEIFAASVLRNPHAVAAVYKTVTLTYQQLDRWSHCIAATLIEHGVIPGSIVAICMERSLTLLAVMIGILKAGAAYLPLEIDSPQEYKNQIFSDSQAVLLVVSEHFSQTLSIQKSIFSEQLEELYLQVKCPSCILPPNNPSAIAYVLYTSGSTGQPKGVLVPQRGIVNRLIWMKNEFCLTSKDKIFQKTPYTFDVSVQEFFCPLIVGGTVVFAEPGGHRDPLYILQTIISEQITWVHFVPSMLSLFLEESGLMQCTSIRYVICSGEVLTPSHVARFFASMPQTVRLYNLYGPTEASVDVSYFECIRGKTLSVVPIGKPISNIQLFILTKQLELVPIDTEGELYIGGVGLADGYLNRSELTQQSFILNPFVKQNPCFGNRLYKTGDRAKWLDSGDIVYLGRTDNQIKIRGMRVEIGEIEHQIRQIASISETIVLPIKTASNEITLFAFVTFLQAKETSSEKIRAFLKNRILDHMIPTHIIILNSMPHTSSGKIDRQILAQKAASKDQFQTTLFSDARNEMEKKVTTIWCKILGVGNASIHDNFFDIGGTSLSLARLNNALRKETSVEIPLIKMFELPTISLLAEFILHANA